MPSYETHGIARVLSHRPGLQRLQLTDGSRAYNLTQLTGLVEEGQQVVVNTTAVQLGLGTGGWHVVHWNLSNVQLDLPGRGHIMKLRYTSLQADTGAAEEDHSSLPAHLGHVPVVVCSLHSQMGVVAAAFAHAAPGRRLAYVMTDGAALPLALSDLVHELIDRDLLCGTVTAGHAFGGEHEAVNIPSALTIARHVLHADAIVVAMGPGVVGTGTALGTTALEVGPIVDAAAGLSGRPVLCVRASSGDGRERHLGVSHHTQTTATFFINESYLLPVPSGDEHLDGLIDIIHGSEAETVSIDVPEVADLLTAAGLRITTMGRGPTEDPVFFRFAAAAGIAAAQRLVA
jgi:hypothetical protein